MPDYDIGKAFARIEKELIASAVRNMDHHRAEETKEGYEWAQWQVEQLRALEQYRKRNKKKFAKRFQEINGWIPHLIEEARKDGQMDQEVKILEALKKGFNARKGSGDIEGAFFEVNDRKLNALIKATTDDFKRAEIAILRRSEDQYRKIIFDAQVYANAGGTTYEKAVDMATKDFIGKGIDCIEYANGARHTISDYADMAIRTAVKRAYLTGEGEKRKEWGIATVIVNKRGNPCPKCAPFCGKVLIDDVWSGGSRKDGPYPLMSTAISHGLYHPRCKDVHTTYFPGISTADDTWTEEELRNIGANYEADQKRQHAKKQAEKYDRLSELSLDPENKTKYGARAEEWKMQARRIKEYGSTQEAEEAAKEMGVKYAEYSKFPKEIANILNDAIETLPAEARPLFVGDSSTLEKYRGVKLPRKSSQFYGVTIDAPPDGVLLGHDPVTGRMVHDFDAQGSMVGISSRYNTPAKIEAAKRKSQNSYMDKHDGRKWYFNEKGEATIYHEMGHAYQEKFGLPEGFEADALRWAKESGCDMLKTPSEAFSEAWGAYHTNNPDLPEYIARYIEKLSNSPSKRAISSVAKPSDFGIIKENKGKLEMNLQFFAEKDIKRQESNSLKRAIRKYRKRIADHEGYIQNPKEHVPDWDDLSEAQRKGLIRHWDKEIRNFNTSIDDRIAELKERGDLDEQHDAGSY